jgi:hypothetical protein
MEASPVYLGTDLSCQSHLQPHTLQIKLAHITVDGKNASCFYYQENIQALNCEAVLLGHWSATF